MSRRKVPFISQAEEHGNTAPIDEVLMVRDLYNGIARRRTAGTPAGIATRRTARKTARLQTTADLPGNYTQTVKEGTL